MYCIYHKRNLDKRMWFDTTIAAKRTMKTFTIEIRFNVNFMHRSYDMNMIQWTIRSWVQLKRTPIMTKDHSFIVDFTDCRCLLLNCYSNSVAYKLNLYEYT